MLVVSASHDLRETILSTRTGGLMADAVRELRPLLPQGAADFLNPWFDLLQRRNA